MSRWPYLLRVHQRYEVAKVAVWDWYSQPNPCVSIYLAMYKRIRMASKKELCGCHLALSSQIQPSRELHGIDIAFPDEVVEGLME